MVKWLHFTPVRVRDASTIDNKASNHFCTQEYLHRLCTSHKQARAHKKLSILNESIYLKSLRYTQSLRVLWDRTNWEKHLQLKSDVLWLSRVFYVKEVPSFTIRCPSKWSFQFYGFFNQNLTEVFDIATLTRSSYYYWWLLISQTFTNWCCRVPIPNICWCWERWIWQTLYFGWLQILSRKQSSAISSLWAHQANYLTKVQSYRSSFIEEDDDNFVR